MSIVPPSGTGPGPEGFGEEKVASDLRLTRVHGAILREQPEPKEGYEPVPLWLVTACMIVVFWAGAYLFYYSGGFRFDQYDQMAAWRGGMGRGGPSAPPDPRTLGKRLFTANCVACHQTTGQGVPGQFPPLVGSHFVIGPGSNRVALIVLHGLQGPVEVNGMIFNGAMPAWGPKLKDDQIAAILTYIRSEWGNQASPIGPQGIAALREKFAQRSESWTVPELMAQPPEELPGPPAAPPEVVASAKGAPAPATQQPAPPPGAAPPPAPGGAEPPPQPAPAPVPAPPPAPAPAPAPAPEGQTPPQQLPR